MLHTILIVSDVFVELTVLLLNIRSKTTDSKTQTVKFWTFLRAVFFSDIPPQAMQTNENKTKQMGLYQTKRFLHSKGNYQQNEKTTYQMEEDIHQ